MHHLNSTPSGLHNNWRAEASTVEAGRSSFSSALSPEVVVQDDGSLKELEKEHENLTNINVRQENRIESLQSKVYELIGFYLVFQGVVLTSVAQGSLLRCHNWWLPFSLSAIAAVAITLAMLHMLLKLSRFSLELKINRLEAEKLQHKIFAKRRPARSMRIEQQPAESAAHFDNWESKLRRSVYPTVVVLTLLTFTTFVLIACKRVLCSPGPFADPTNR